VFIIDLHDDFDVGLRQIASFKQWHPAGRVVVLADQHQPTNMVSAFRAGANAYLAKVTTCERFVKSLELVMLGVTLLPLEILKLVSDRQVSSRCDRTAAVADDAQADNDDVGMGEIVGAEYERDRGAGPDNGHAPLLSARQQAILRCLAEGDSNKTIARKMAMAEATVKVHVKAVLRRIRVRNRTQAAIWAMGNGALLLAKHDSPPISESLPVAGAPSEGYENGSTSLATIKLEEASPTKTPGHLRLVRKQV
jgi:two-component system nitrate/nitrite response regulator NarL